MLLEVYVVACVAIVHRAVLRWQDRNKIEKEAEEQKKAEDPEASE